MKLHKKKCILHAAITSKITVQDVERAVSNELGKAVKLVKRRRSASVVINCAITDSLTITSNEWR